MSTGTSVPRPRASGPDLSDSALLDTLAARGAHRVRLLRHRPALPPGQPGAGPAGRPGPGRARRAHAGRGVAGRPGRGRGRRAGPACWPAACRVESAPAGAGRACPRGDGRPGGRAPAGPALVVLVVPLARLRRAGGRRGADRRRPVASGTRRPRTCAAARSGTARWSRPARRWSGSPRPTARIAEDSPAWRWITGQSVGGVPAQRLAGRRPPRRPGAGGAGLADSIAVRQGVRQPVPDPHPVGLLPALRRPRGGGRAGREDHRVGRRQHRRHRPARGRGDARPADRAAVGRRAAHRPAAAGHLDAGRGAHRGAGGRGHHRGRPVGHRRRALGGGHAGPRPAAAADRQPGRPARHPRRAQRGHPAGHARA